MTQANLSHSFLTKLLIGWETVKSVYRSARSIMPFPDAILHQSNHIL